MKEDSFSTLQKSFFHPYKRFQYIYIHNSDPIANPIIALAIGSGSKVHCSLLLSFRTCLHNTKNGKHII